MLKYNLKIQTIDELNKGKIFNDKKCKDNNKLKLIYNWLSKEIRYCDFRINSNYEIDSPSTKDIYIDFISNELPSYINFNIVNGSFILRGGEYKTLRGVPKKIGGRFSCSSNKLESLKYAPILIGFNRKKGDYCNFNCSDNMLTNLEYSPYVVMGDYFCHNNRLKNLYGIQNNINGNLICNKNKIESFKDLPKIIKGDLNISNNLIKNIYDCDLPDDIFIEGNIIINKKLNDDFKLIQRMLKIKKIKYINKQN